MQKPSDMLRLMLYPLLALSVVFSCKPALAEVTLWVWQPTPSSMRTLIPRLDHESAENSVQRYRRGVNASHELMKLLGARLSSPIGEIHSFAPHGLTTILVANDPLDLSSNPVRMKQIARPLSAAGADVYMIPIAADTGLGQKDAREYRSLISRTASLIVGVGGDDIDPVIDGQNNERGLSNNVNTARDISEARLWQEVLSTGHAYVVGICRAHQMILSLLGYHLTLDIESELGLASHRFGNHELKVQTPSVLDSLLTILPNGEVNTLHHQAFFEMPADGPVQVVATDGHGIAEAAVFKNGRGMTFQFHPELMAPDIATRFAQLAVEQGRLSALRPPTPLSARHFEINAEAQCRSVLSAPIASKGLSTGVYSFYIQ